MLLRHCQTPDDVASVTVATSGSAVMCSCSWSHADRSWAMAKLFVAPPPLSKALALAAGNRC